MRGDLPRALKKRLELTTHRAVQSHPDADLLAAFSEGGLLQRERSVVAAHLADCADCRDYVFLAHAGTEQVIPLPATTRRLAKWRWAFGTAALCAMLVAGIQVARRPPSTVAVMLGKKEVSPPSAPISGAETPSTAPQARMTPRRKSAVLAESVSPSPKDMSPAAAPDALPRLNDPAAALRNLLPAAPPDIASGRTQRSAEAEMARLEPVDREHQKTSSLDRVLDQVQAVPPPSQTATTGFRPNVLDLRQGKPEAFKAQPTRLSPAIKRAVRSDGGVAQAPRWTISSTGERPRGIVQRSLDGGRRWEETSLPAHIDFRAVNAAGSDVWAGGSEGRVFHSTDSGAKWEQVPVGNDRTSLTGTVISIAVDRPGSITLRTSSGETWRSDNNGRIWREE